uniref:Uncharacterized protein n=1 Tax=Melicertus latisulcatus pemonivirus TaxID=2984278 RepID=A0A9C7F7Z4_9VIRU|nr:MAG: hypothetical protein [Melicertus latisulcatus pemonivirus]
MVHIYVDDERRMHMYREFLILKMQGKVQGSTLSELDTTIKYYHRVSLNTPGSGNPVQAAAPEAPKSHFAIPQVPAIKHRTGKFMPIKNFTPSTGQFRKKSNYTSGYVSSSGEMSEGLLDVVGGSVKERFPAENVGKDFNYHFDRFLKPGNMRSSVLDANKHFSSNMHNLQSQWTGYLITVPDKISCPAIKKSELEQWKRNGYLYTCRHLMKRGGISHRELLDYDRKYSKNLDRDDDIPSRKRKNHDAHDRTRAKRTRFSSVVNHDSDSSSTSDDLDDRDREQGRGRGTGLPRYENVMDYQHPGEAALKYVNSVDNTVEPINDNEICYEIPLQKWPYVPHTRERGCFVPRGLGLPKRPGIVKVTNLEAFAYDYLSTVSLRGRHRGESIQPDGPLRAQRTKIIKKSIRSQKRQAHGDDHPVTMNECIIDDLADPVSLMWEAMPKSIKSRSITLMHYRVIASACRNLFNLGWDIPPHLTRKARDPKDMARIIMMMGFKKFGQINFTLSDNSASVAETVRNVEDIANEESDTDENRKSSDDSDISVRNDDDVDSNSDDDNSSDHDVRKETSNTDPDVRKETSDTESDHEKENNDDKGSKDNTTATVTANATVTATVTANANADANSNAAVTVTANANDNDNDDATSTAFLEAKANAAAAAFLDAIDIDPTGECSEAPMDISSQIFSRYYVSGKLPDHICITCNEYHSKDTKCDVY